LLIGVARAKPPRVFLLDASRLEKAKRLLSREDIRIITAWTALKQQADTALRATAPSVLDGPPPPSGDTHDYFSLSIYWWPNPKTETGLPYVRRDGRVNPEVDRYDLPRINAMARDVETLALAYYFSGRRSYARKAAELLRVWFLDEETKMNPNMKYAQTVPGVSEGRREAIIESVVLATRVVDAVGLIGTSQAWSERDQQQIKQWFSLYLHWLQTSRQGKEESLNINNHGTWYDVQRVAFALFSGNKALARKFFGNDVDGAAHLRREPPNLMSVRDRINLQFSPDGSQPAELARTKSFDYSCYNLDAMFALVALGQSVDVDLWGYRGRKGRSIPGALDYLVQFLDPKLKWKHKQIYERDRGKRLAPFLHRAAYQFEDRKYRPLALKHPLASRDRLNLLVPPVR